MLKLTRAVRFSINPCLPKDTHGFNSFASEPVGDGLSVFFELYVQVVGEVEPTSGFVVNVSDIDSNVRRYAVPIFAGRVRQYFRQGRHIGFFEIAGLLKSVWGELTDKFGRAKLGELSLKLNPFRKVTADCEDCRMIYFSEKFEFAAAHRLWNDEFSEQRNFEVFGKCANPAGHGHNYVVEVVVKVPVGENNFHISDFEKIVDDELIKVVDHRNLNAEVAQFSRVNPTVENIAVFAFNRLAGKFREAPLHCVTVWENDSTCCSYYGQ
jgi:6-pyruvoyltetrahydropterin/6-carboxytetrahydropterin synthase